MCKLTSENMTSSQKAFHKLYNDFQSLLVPTHHGKNLLISFLMGFLFWTNWKKNSYNAILVIINQLMKIVYYKPVKTTIHVVGLVVIIITMIISHHNLFEFIVGDWDLLLTSKFYSLLCYFFAIKKNFPLHLISRRTV